MKITATQLRNIIKEEVAKVTQASKKSGAVKKFKDALAKAPEMAGDDDIADEALAAIKSGKSVAAVASALRASLVHLQGGAPDYSDMYGVIEKISAKDPAVGRQLMLLADPYDR